MRGGGGRIGAAIGMIFHWGEGRVAFATGSSCPQSRAFGLYDHSISPVTALSA